MPLSLFLNLLKSSDFSKVFPCVCFSWCLGANFHNRRNLLFKVFLIYPKTCLQVIVSPPSDKPRQMEWTDSEWRWLSVSPQLGIDVLHVPAERLAVQLPPQRDAVCNATRRKKKTQERVETSREREREENGKRGMEDVREKYIKRWASCWWLNTELMRVLLEVSKQQ